MNRYRIERSNRAAFTLMELMLVMAILIMLAGMGIGAYMQIQNNANSDAASIMISNLENSCKQFRLNTGRFPQKLDDLYIKPGNMTPNQWRGPYIEDQVPRDPWGNEYRFAVDNQRDRVIIRSFGKDGTENTQDDIPERTGTNQ